ncbi:glycosyltransferase family 4 protein [Algoriphagus sp. C2-6-M1]|uniref:glycosyltransferase family 4 protein n=1 Tax=Algoriphagus persicinus TaxID=3108754 RepID=UPI002B3DBCDE|nr:glycosyltransferase family 4 protein [Algoriphagus sp. C2-6-M1]MEB2781263.1 glycosyltransferase family 4 protein [Algoriphagus sp. C2-6-M1]
MQDKRVLIIGEVFFPEEFVINDLARYWKKKGYFVEVLTRTPSYPIGQIFSGYKNKLYQKTFYQNIPIHRVPVIQGYQKSKVIKIFNYLSFVVFSSIVALFIGRKFDRIFIYQTGPLTVALPGVLLKKIYNKNLTIWTQDLWPETVYAYGFKPNRLLDFLLNNLVKLIYNSADKIAVSCKGFSPKINSYLKSKKNIVWIPNWSLINESATRKLKLPGSINFTFAGNIGKVQNLDNVLHGFNKAVKEFPDAYLNIVGNGSSLKELKSLVNNEKIPNVNFTGRKPLIEMPDYFEASDVLIISLVDAPIYEIMIPSKFQTYLQYKKPIFAVMKGEVPKMISEYKLGLSADSNNIDMIAARFKEMMTLSKTELDSMSLSAQKLLSHSFDRYKNLKKLSQITFE